eukprot:Colp12_sorted_trinity150504_noHs@17846
MAYSFTGYVSTEAEAQAIFKAAREGRCRVVRRLTQAEQEEIVPGVGYVYYPQQSGIKRWTDGKKWSDSHHPGGTTRIYKEVEFCKNKTGQTVRVEKDNGLRKKTINDAQYHGQDQLRLVCYYTEDTCQKSSPIILHRGGDVGCCSLLARLTTGDYVIQNMPLSPRMSCSVAPSTPCKDELKLQSNTDEPPKTEEQHPVVHTPVNPVVPTRHVLEDDPIGLLLAVAATMEKQETDSGVGRLTPPPMSPPSISMETSNVRKVLPKTHEPVRYLPYPRLTPRPTNIQPKLEMSANWIPISMAPHGKLPLTANRPMMTSW